mgnify:CR=1 FL=1
MNEKDKEWLQLNWMKLKKIKRDIVMMTIAPLKGEDHYEILKDAIYPIDRALTIMEKLIKEDQCIR